MKLELKLRIRNLTRGAELASSADAARTSRQRRQGLLPRDRLPAGEGLWISPCEAIHTFGMKFPIDALFLGQTRKVLKIRKDMGPRRLALCLRAAGVLELPAGTAEATGTLPGDQLEFEKL